jgi:uncharacterized protein YlxW (UPF0749 family)
MYKMEDILAQLNSGMSATDIATNFTEALNGAIKAQETAQAEKAQKQEKLADAQKVADAINEFVAKYYPEVKDTKLADAQAIVDLYDATIDLVTSFENLGNGFKFTMKSPTTSSKKAYAKPAVKTKTADDVFSKFLKINGLL